MIKTLQKVGIEGTYLNIIKAIYNKPTASHHFQWWKTESTSLKIRNKTRMSTLTTLIQHRFGSPHYGNHRSRRNKRNPNWKRSKSVSVCRRQVITHRKFERCQLLDLINEFSKVAGYKINTQKSLAFLYTNNERAGREIKKTILVTIKTKRIKYPGTNLPKEQKICTHKTIKHRWKRSKRTQTDEETDHVLGLEESIYSENDHIMQSNLQLQCNSYQITNGILYWIRTKNCIICMETQKTPKSQSNLETEKWSWLSDFKL